MTARDIAALFEDLELRLIASLKRNLARHKAQEQAEGGKGGVPERWSAWQAETLRNLDRFRRENRVIMGAYTDKIDAETRALLRQEFSEADGSEGAFFGINGRKLDALIDEITQSEARVEKAALRYMDDIYRKTILRAAASMAAGGMTLQQATDLAVQDFLAQGVNCVRYRNGRRVNIATYAEMALRTNGTRAMLLGEAQLRERLGIDTVLCSQYGGCSETCLPWQGLVYIDDVWQPYRGAGANFGGTYGYSRNGRSYPLLSVAVKAGLFHPNCRHHLTTWIEGVSVRPESMDKAEVERISKLEKKQRYLEAQVRRWKRLAEGTQESTKAAEYRRKVRIAQRRVRAFVDAHDDVLRRDYWRERYDQPLQVSAEHDKLDAQSNGNILITGKAIYGVQKFPTELLNEQGQNELKFAHQSLLMEASRAPLGVEKARCYDLRMRSLTEVLTGVRSQSRIKIPDCPVPYIAAHTHPDGLTFSPADVKQFALRPNMKMLTAVGHNGTIYVLEKSVAFQAEIVLSATEKCLKALQNVTTVQEAVKYMEALLNGAGRFGLVYKNYPRKN